jgi:ABC-type oligopeptide transport system ATPase subunit
MYIVVIGEDGSGKSTVARSLGNRLGIRVVESGEVLARKFALLLSDTAQLREQTPKHFLEKLTHEKETHRPALRKFGNSLSKVAPDLLIHECLGDNSPCIVVGLRRMSEHKAWQRAMRKRGECSVWIRVVRNRKTNKSFELAGTLCEFVIHNDGSMQSLKLQASEIVKVLRSRRYMQAA